MATYVSARAVDARALMAKVLAFVALALLGVGLVTAQEQPSELERLKAENARLMKAATVVDRQSSIKQAKDAKDELSPICDAAGARWAWGKFKIDDKIVTFAGCVGK